MSSPPKEATDLKGGHAPAVKVGGMRVVQHKKEADKTEAPMTAAEEIEYSSSPSKGTQPQLVSGVAVKGDKDFTPQALKSFHEKPQPTHEAKPRAPQNTMPIHQPR